MAVFSVWLVHRDGARDFYDLGRFDSEAAALRRARELMMISQSAASLEVHSEGRLLTSLSRSTGPLGLAA